MHSNDKSKVERKKIQWEGFQVLDLFHLISSISPICGDSRQQSWASYRTDNSRPRNTSVSTSFWSSSPTSRHTSSSRSQVFLPAQFWISHFTLFVYLAILTEFVFFSKSTQKTPRHRSLSIWSIWKRRRRQASRRPTSSRRPTFSPYSACSIRPAKDPSRTASTARPCKHSPSRSSTWSQPVLPKTASNSTCSSKKRKKHGGNFRIYLFRYLINKTSFVFFVL